MREMFTSVTPALVGKSGGLLVDEYDGWLVVRADGAVTPNDRILVPAADQHDGPNWALLDRAVDAYYGHRHEKVGVGAVGAT